MLGLMRLNFLSVAAVTLEANTLLAPLNQTSREFVRDPVLLEFLGLPGTGRLLESDLEQGLMDKLQALLLELGKGFGFVARQKRISTQCKDFYIHLVNGSEVISCNWARLQQRRLISFEMLHRLRLLTRHRQKDRK